MIKEDTWPMTYMKQKNLYMHFSRLYGYVKYGIIATGFNPVTFWEHLVPLNYEKFCSNHNICVRLFCAHTKLFFNRIQQWPEKVIMSIDLKMVQDHHDHHNQNRNALKPVKYYKQ